LADRLYRLSLIVVPRLFVALIRLWFGTCRVRITGQEHLDYVAERGQGIAVFWHYSFVFLFYQMRKFPAAAMVSASKDGEYIARVARLLGHTPLRGSSNRFGTRALRQMVDAVQNGQNAAIVADGSQGPPRKVQSGCLLVSSKTGCPILPMVWAANRYFAFKSWDRTAIPLPFSTVYLQYGEPLEVEAGAKSEQIAAHRLNLEEQLNKMYKDVWKRAGRSPHDSK